VHMANHDVTLCDVSRAPIEKLQAYTRRMRWTFPWASAFGSNFNFNFSVDFTVEQQSDLGIEYNYQREAPLKARSSGGSEIPAQLYVGSVDGARVRVGGLGVSAMPLSDANSGSHRGSRCGPQDSRLPRPVLA